MSNIILIYKTNSWHEYSSRELIAVATTEKKRDILIRRFLRNELYEKPSMKTIETAMEQISEMGQTQCLAEECDIEIDTEQVTTNEILY